MAYSNVFGRKARFFYSGTKFVRVQALQQSNLVLNQALPPSSCVVVVVAVRVEAVVVAPAAPWRR